ncbi:helix-turn-helix transcriptional regulator [Bradyrhizobium sp. CCGUVB4N]|uniref:response regulator transcription factor n=1 Tax=Bradyrhizobium sp. CCGUVB4N TaxID=2949631 RepID=UPI0020B224D8|nr:helix-turn-helix transcriptional regulator [Bradyrhizobium sp. CCGUVB4N]MCP3385974.1 helix-turn-helix transcriptional regulator [Bradyrhizobium sp. CCGUVB4N]
MTHVKLILKRPTKKLAPRESDILTLLAYGNTRDAISNILSLSEETVKDYIARACRKLGAVNKTNAIAIAIAFGLITPRKERYRPTNSNK